MLVLSQAVYIHLHATSFLPGYFTDILDLTYPDFKLLWYINIFSSPPCLHSMIFLGYHVSLCSIHIYPQSPNYLNLLLHLPNSAGPAQMSHS